MPRLAKKPAARSKFLDRLRVSPPDRLPTKPLDEIEKAAQHLKIVRADLATTTAEIPPCAALLLTM